jgi:hypothetical protein
MTSLKREVEAVRQDLVAIKAILVRLSELYSFREMKPIRQDLSTIKGMVLHTHTNTGKIIEGIRQIHGDLEKDDDEVIEISRGAWDGVEKAIQDLVGRVKILEKEDQ